MITEILFKVGDGTKAKDGMPLAVKGEGYLLTPAELTTYIQSEVLPAGFLALPENEQAGHLRRINQIKYLTQAGLTAGQVATKKWGYFYTTGYAETRLKMEEIALGYIMQAIEDKIYIMNHGLDTNWGFVDLTVFGVVRADVTPMVAEDLIERELDEAAHPYAEPTYLRFRKWRVPYETLVPNRVANWRNRTIHVAVNRISAPFTEAQVKEAAQA
jgi:hypothetical protein